MQNDKALREHLVQILKGGGAHVDFDGAIREVLPKVRGEIPEAAEHSLWQLLEHMRIAQWDILEFIRNPKHKSPKFPEGYWPKSRTPPDEKAWDKTAEAFRADLQSLIALVEDQSTDLFAKLPQGDRQTVLREVLVVADHSAYHIGTFVLLRRILGAWHE
jgi:hypothetical protein